MKRILIIISCLIAIAFIVAYFVTKSNNSSFTPETIDLRADCSGVSRFGITSTTTITVENMSSRKHSNIRVKVMASDKNGDKIKLKYVYFDRSLGPYKTISKTVTLPAKARSCDCEIEGSTPD